MSFSADTCAALIDAGLEVDGVAAVIDRALAEDFADGPDVTTVATIAAGVIGRALVVPRQPGVLAGGPIAVAVIETLLGPVSATRTADGSRIRAGVPVLDLSVELAGLLSAERTALNLLGHLSGIATATSHWVDAVAGTGAAIRDTRKTLPGLRALEKYAVRCGGGVNHRMSLGDAALIKDNHVAAAGSVRAAIEAVRSVRPDIPLEVEVDILIQLDTFTRPDTAEAVCRTRAGCPAVTLESSGGLVLTDAAAVAATGVGYLAVGALTHSCPALDLGLDLR